MHQEPLAPGQYLAYRKPDNGGAGSWFARWHREGKIIQSRLGTADDFQDADKRPPSELLDRELDELKILSYAHAQAKAQKWCDAAEHQAIHGDESLPTDGPLTVTQAVERYLVRIEAKGGKSIKDMRQRAALWILPTLGDIEVAKLTRAKVEKWHQSIADSERKAKPKKPAPKVKHPPEEEGTSKPGIGTGEEGTACGG